MDIVVVKLLLYRWLLYRWRTTSMSSKCADLPSSPSHTHLHVKAYLENSHIIRSTRRLVTVSNCCQVLKYKIPGSRLLTPLTILALLD